MGRNWIKIETVTMDKPEVCVIATQLKMDPDAVVGKLVRLWSWAEVNRINSSALNVTLEFLDKLVGKKGFGAALMKAGWLKESDGVMQFPNFGRHNGPTGKGRALTAMRVSRHRDRKRVSDDGESDSEDELEQSAAPRKRPLDGRGQAGNQRRSTVKELLNNDLTNENMRNEEVEFPDNAGDFRVVADVSGIEDVAIVGIGEVETVFTDSSGAVESVVESVRAPETTLEENMDPADHSLEHQNEGFEEVSEDQSESAAAPKVKKVKAGKKSSGGESPDQPLLF